MTRSAAQFRLHRFNPTRIAALVALLLFAIFILPAAADGILVPTRPDAPNFAIKYHRVEVKIADQIATTSIDQVFENKTGRQQEAVYLFPLPHGASVRKFTLYEGGNPMHAELLNRDKAREIYESIVRKRKDPGLLEYVGRDTYRVSVFPIPAGGTKRIQIEYSELLRYDGGIVAYNYPLSTEKFSSELIEEVKVDIAIDSRAAINTVYSPTHELKIDRPDAHSAFAGLEEHGTKPNMDLLLYYTVSEKELGTSVLTYKEGEEDGFFLLLGAPSAAMVDRAPQPKDVVFVLDKSGSMSGEKIEQAKGALQFFLNSLNPKDRFRIVTFSDHVRTLGKGEALLSASRGNIQEARVQVDKIEANGGTNIDSALKTALQIDFDRGGASYIVFLTDGLPTVGNTNIESIIKNVKSANSKGDARRARLFAFGAGYDVNTIFLEKITLDNGGLVEFVRPSEDIEVKVSRFFAKVAQPILTDVSLGIEGVETFDIFPKEMPDIFAGSQLVVMGRYRTEKTVNAKVNITGYASPKQKVFNTTVRFVPDQPENEYIAPLWAARKIAWLLDEVQVHGKQDELVKEIVDLSTRYGILTEYTAFLALEGDALSEREAVARAVGSVKHKFAAPAARSGGAAVAARKSVQTMRGQSNLAQQNIQYDAAGEQFRYSQVQTRNNQAFFQRGGRWEDARYKEGQQNIVRVRAYSEAYFQISRRAPHLNQVLTMGENVLFVTNGQAVEIAPDGKEEFTEQELDELLGPARAALPVKMKNAVAQATSPDGQTTPLGLAMLLAVGAVAMVVRLRVNTID